MIHKQLQAARIAAGLSVHEVAECVGLSLAEIEDFEDGRVAPSSPVLIKLGQALNVRVACFFSAKFERADGVRCIHPLSVARNTGCCILDVRRSGWALLDAARALFAGVR
jgi:transcriptional regulator with XRE-family HTH domain